MLTCFIRYVVDPTKINEFKEYATYWIALIEQNGGTHHGYFLPGENHTSDFSFPTLGQEGPENIAIALFSFPNFEAYEGYKKRTTANKECQAMTKKFNDSKCFLSYERSFLKPFFN